MTQEACPHCGAVLDVDRAVKDGDAGLSGARRHQPTVPTVDDAEA